MKRVLLGAALLAALSISTTAFAAASSTATATPASTTSDADQKALKSKCTAAAKAQGLKGDDRKKFMTDCLAGKAPTTAAAAPAAATPVAASSTSTSDQQSLMKTCNADATKQNLKGDARKAFMKTCLSGKPATTATVVPPLTTATTTTAAVPAATSATVDSRKGDQQLLMKTCNAQAKTKDLKGDARKAFMSSCLSGKQAVGSTPAASALTTTTPKPAPAPAPVPAKPIAPGAPVPAGTTLTSGQFATDVEAKRHCPNDLAIWVNTKSKIYHFAGSSDYGKSKAGVYMCQKEADAAGDRAAKNEKPPATH